MVRKRYLLALAVCLAIVVVLRHHTEPKLPQASAKVQIVKPAKAAQSAKTDRDPGLPVNGNTGIQDCWAQIRAQHHPGNFRERANQALDSVVGTWFYSTEPDDRPFLRNETSPPGKFFLALEKAGLLEGVGSDHIDDAEALALLEEVAQADPANSAPYFYGAIIAERHGDHARALELADNAEFTARFDSYLTTVSTTLFKQVQTGSDLVDAYDIWSRIPIPNYSELRKFLITFNRPHAAQQMAGAAFDKVYPIMDIDWLGVEYATAKGILDTLGAGSDYPPYKELFEKREAANKVTASMMEHELEKTCDEESLTPYVQLLQDHLTNGY